MLLFYRRIPLLLWLGAAWLAGIWLGAAERVPALLLWGGLCSAAGVALLGWYSPLVRRAAVLLVLLAGGMLWYQRGVPTTTPQSVWLLAGTEQVYLLGYVAAAPRQSVYGQQVIVETSRARVVNREDDVHGRVLLRLPTYPAYHYGQRLLVRGTLAAPRPASRPGAFDERDYLARQGIFAVMGSSRDSDAAPEVLVVPGEAGNPVLRGLLGFRRLCNDLIIRAMPEPHASVTAGMLLGLQAAIPPDTYEAFRRTGVAHILVVSGWQMSLIALLVAGQRSMAPHGSTAPFGGRGLAGVLGLNAGGAFWLGMGCIWGYALLVGGSAAVLRAALMASMVLLAGAVGRQTSPWVLLMAACLVMTLVQPHVLWDVGFQLSLTATAGLLAFATPFTRWLVGGRLGGLALPRWVAEVLGTTLAAQVAVLPVLLYHFGTLSVIAPIANLLIAPLVPVITGVGAGVLLLHLVLLPVLWVPLFGDGLAMLVQGVWLLLWLLVRVLVEGVTLLGAVPYKGM